MLSKAKSKYIRISPYKLRPYIDVIRGNAVDKALSWLKTCALKRVRPIAKTLFSAYSNAKNLNPDVGSMSDLVIKEIRVDQGPIIRYFKPGAQGRANMQRKRLCHLEIILDKKADKVVAAKQTKQQAATKKVAKKTTTVKKAKTAATKTKATRTKAKTSTKNK